MVRTRRDVSPSTTRRSSRLRNRGAASKPSVAAQVKSTSATRTRRKRISAAIIPQSDTRGEDAFSKSPAKPIRASGSDPPRSREISSRESSRRERLLARKELELKNRTNDLERRLISLEKRENNAAEMMSQIPVKEKESILNQLQEHFLCCLCYEVLAAPYVLNPSNCGHTFCALCILKWFFSRLHRHCGTWHESVDCPMCRSPLIVTPEHIPRLQLTFPFVPNRVAASVIESLVAKLVEQPRFSQTNNEEENERKWRPKSPKKCRSSAQMGMNSEDKISEQGYSDIAVWTEGGRMKKDWLERDRQGRQEMAYLLKKWSMMQAQDFITMKEKLGV